VGVGGKDLGWEGEGREGMGKEHLFFVHPSITQPVLA